MSKFNEHVHTLKRIVSNWSVDNVEWYEALDIGFLTDLKDEFEDVVESGDMSGIELEECTEEFTALVDDYILVHGTDTYTVTPPEHCTHDHIKIRGYVDSHFNKSS